MLTHRVTMHFRYNHCETVRRLISLNANPDSADNNGNTPLHFCAQNGHIESARLLLSGMVVIDAQNNRGDTPLHNATRWNDAQLVEQLIKEYVVLTFNRPRLGSQ